MENRSRSGMNPFFFKYYTSNYNILGYNIWGGGVMGQFINRLEEQEFLKNEYEKSGSSLVILYGRRRIGKTALISEFGRTKNMLYFLATEESETENRNQFKDLVADYTGNELLKNVTVANWETLFDVLVHFPVNEKKLIVLDEFQYLGRANPAFPSVFQKIWDTKLKDQPVMVILCGSLISLMETQTLVYSSPLYGRRTGQIKLQQIPFQHYQEFFPAKGYRELIEYYSVTGGVPKYIELFRDCDGVYYAIARNVLSKQSFLYEEPVFLLQNEVAEIGSYFSIIKAIAAGNSKLGNIAAALQMKPTGLTKYLKTLIDLDILERQVPITEDNPEKSKKGLYRIKDHFIEFWFKFIYPYKNFIEIGNADFVMHKIRADLVGRQIAPVYEEICRAKMWLLFGAKKFPFCFDKVGRWWDNHSEIDIVAYDSAGQDIVFGECKYTNAPLDIDVFETLLQKKTAITWKKSERREYFIFFCINGFTKRMRILADSRNDILLYE
jgi:AAA+ ATPase superfamily predicted ATPase